MECRLPEAPPHSTPCTCWVETQFLLQCCWKLSGVPSVSGGALLSRLFGSFLDCAKSYLVFVSPPTPNWCFIFFSWSKIVYPLLFQIICPKGKQHSEIVFEINEHRNALFWGGGFLASLDIKKVGQGYGVWGCILGSQSVCQPNNVVCTTWKNWHREL